MTFILMVFNLKLERRPLNLKAVNFEITCQQILKHYSHPPLLSTDSGITYYTLLSNVDVMNG